MDDVTRVKADQQEESVTQDFAGTFAVALSQGNGQWCTTTAYNGGKGGNQYDDRRRHADTGQRFRSDTGNVADIDPVYQVIEQIDKLGSDCR